MALDVEGVVDGGVDRQEPLLFFAASSYRLMRILRAIVYPQSLIVNSGQPQGCEVQPRGIGACRM